MRVLRRLLRYVVVTLGVLVILLLLAVAATQTGWFKEWLRRYLVREAAQYLHGELRIGRLSGNLFYGVRLSDIALVQNGEAIVTLKDLRLDYSAFELMSSGIVLDQIELNQPVVVARRTSAGWNLMHLVKKQAEERERRGPARPITLASIVIHDGRATVDRGEGAAAPRVTKVDDFDATVAFKYEPVNYTVEINNISFRAADPTIALSKLSGKVAVAGDDIHVDGLFVRLPETELKADGVIREYKKVPHYELVLESSKTTFSEVGVVLPAVATIQPQPSYRIKTSGPIDRLQAAIDVRSPDAGTTQGTVTLIGGSPQHLQGDLQVARVNLAPWLNREQWKGQITGRVRFDLRLPDAARKQPLGGTYHFTGPAAGAFGYAAEDVDARGRFDGGRIVVEQGRARAYGATATTAGTIDVSKPSGIEYQFKGRASQVDLRRVPKQLSVPALASRLDLDYDISGRQKDFRATALLHPSTVEGASIAGGTRGHFEMSGRSLSYGGDGHLTNLDLRRMGRALKLDALASERFEGIVNGQFRVEASGRTVADLVLDASGVLADTTLFGARLTDVAFETRIERAALAGTVKGGFDGFNPNTLFANERLAGSLNGVLDGRVSIDDLRESIGMDTFGYDGTVTLKDSTLSGLTLGSALFDGTFDEARLAIRQLTVEGPEVSGTAAGTLALDKAGASDLTYRFTVPDLGQIAQRAGVQMETPVAGSAEFGGKVTGNFASLVTNGTAHVKALRYGDTAEAAIVDTTYKVTLPELEPADVRVDAHIDASDIRMPPGDQPDRVIEKVSADTTYANREVGFKGHVVEGPRTIDASGRALLQEGRQEVHLSAFALSTKGVTWRTQSDAEAVIVYDGQTVHVSGLRLENGAQRVSADGIVGAQQGAASTLKIVAEGVDLAEAERLVGTETPEEPRLAGKLSATATVSGTLQQPAVDGQFNVTEGAFRNVKYQSLGGKATYDQRRLTLDVRLEQRPGTALTAKGTLPVSLFAGAEAAKTVGPDEVVNLHVQSTPISLGLVEGLTTAVTKVTGTAQLDMHVRGRGRDIAFDGFVKVENGGLTVTATGAVYSGLNTTLQFEPSRLVVQGLRVIGDGNDPLEVKGVIGLTGTQLGTLDLTAQGKGFELLDNELGEVDVNMDLRIRGELAEPRISGTIDVNRARIEVDRLLRRLTSHAYATEAAAPSPAPGLRESAVPSATSTSAAPAPSAAAQEQAKKDEKEKKAKAPASASAVNRLHLDVRVTIPDNMVLRGKNLRAGAASMGLGNINVTVGGDLRLLRQPSAPMVVLGTVNTVRGTYDYRGRRFDILRDGRIAFQGQDVDNPLLDVTAQRLIEPSGIEARIRIEGTARRPQLTFSSNPPMDESDVIALIVFNRPLSDLESGERASIAELAGSTAAGFIVSPLADTLGRALDLDIFEVGTTSDPVGGTGGVVTAGKQIDENLFFKFRQQFGGQEVSEFILEYQIARYLRVQAAAAEGEGVGRAQRSLTRRIERAGIDLIFHFSY